MCNPWNAKSTQVDLAEQPARRSEMLLQSPDFSDLPQLHVNGEVCCSSSDCSDLTLPLRVGSYTWPTLPELLIIIMCCALQFLGSTHTIQEMEDYSELDEALAKTDPDQ